MPERREQLAADRRRERRARVFGHGDDAPGNELNTVPSFHRARASGADGVELDVRRTADDALVVVHDAALRDGRRIAEIPSAALPPEVPTLGAVLDVCRGLTVNLEIKNYPRDPDFDSDQRVTMLVLDLLESRAWSDDALISCFDFACIDRVRQRAPRVRTAMLYLSRRDPAGLLDAVVAHGHSIVHPYDSMLDAAFMAEARARGIEVNVWLGRVPAARLHALVALGVDGLITAQASEARFAVDGPGLPTASGA